MGRLEKADQGLCILFQRQSDLDHQSDQSILVAQPTEACFVSFETEPRSSNKIAWRFGRSEPSAIRFLAPSAIDRSSASTVCVQNFEIWQSPALLAHIQRHKAKPLGFDLTGPRRRRWTGNTCRAVGSAIQESFAKIRPSRCRSASTNKQVPPTELSGTTGPCCRMASMLTAF